MPFWLIEEQKSEVRAEFERAQPQAEIRGSLMQLNHGGSLRIAEIADGKFDSRNGRGDR